MDSSPARKGHSVELLSPQLSPNENQACLSFWYNMHGLTVGNLTVERIVSQRIIYEGTKVFLKKKRSACTISSGDAVVYVAGARSCLVSYTLITVTGYLLFCSVVGKFNLKKKYLIKNGR